MELWLNLLREHTSKYVYKYTFRDTILSWPKFIKDLHLLIWHIYISYITYKHVYATISDKW